jgi:hypothetical protein
MGILTISNFSEVKRTGRETIHLAASCVMMKNVFFYASALKPIVFSFFNRLRPRFEGKVHPITVHERPEVE